MKATLRDLAGVGLKLLGVYALLQLIGRMDGIMFVFRGAGGMPASRWAAFLLGWSFTSALHLAAAVVLLFFTGRVLKLLFGDGPAGQIDAVPNAHVDGILFVIAGILVLLTGLNHTVQSFVILPLTSGGGPLPAFREAVRKMLPTIIRCGLELGLGVSGIVYGARRLRRARPTAEVGDEQEAGA